MRRAHGATFYGEKTPHITETLLQHHDFLNLLQLFEQRLVQADNIENIKSLASLAIRVGNLFVTSRSPTKETMIESCSLAWRILYEKYRLPVTGWIPYKNKTKFAWWRHQVETFSALLDLCAGNSPVSDEFPAQRPVTRNFDVFFDLRQIKRLSEHSQGWWFETPPHPLRRHSNGTALPCL